MVGNVFMNNLIQMFCISIKLFELAFFLNVIVMKVHVDCQQTNQFKFRRFENEN